MSRGRHGNAIVEFVMVVGPLMYVVFGGIDFALAVWIKQYGGEAARVAAREAATKPGPLLLPANASLPFSDPDVFDEYNTVIDTDPTLLAGGTLDTHFDGLPQANQLLRQIMYSETRSDVGGGSRTLLRLPGILLWNSSIAPSLAQTDLLVRVTDGSAGPTAVLLRIINPPLATDANYVSNGVIRLDCNQWYPFQVWLFGGSPPAYTVATNAPAGYSVVSYGTNVPQLMYVQNRAVSRKDVQ